MFSPNRSTKKNDWPFQCVKCASKFLASFQCFFNFCWLFLEKSTSKIKHHKYFLHSNYKVKIKFQQHNANPVNLFMASSLNSMSALKTFLKTVKLVISRFRKIGLNFKLCYVTMRDSYTLCWRATSMVWNWTMRRWSKWQERRVWR